MLIKVLRKMLQFRKILGEHGLSLYIETKTEDYFDFGASNLCIEHARNWD